MLLCFVAGIFIAHRTRFGANVYALGGGRRSDGRVDGCAGIEPTTIPDLRAFGLFGGPIRRSFSRSIPLPDIRWRRSGWNSTPSPRWSLGDSVDRGSRIRSGNLYRSLDTRALFRRTSPSTGRFSSWWTKIVVGALLFAFIALQRILVFLSTRRAMVNAIS